MEQNPLMSDLFKDIIPSILQTKKDCLVNENDYKPIILNKALSFHYDCIEQANRMNLFANLDPYLQYHYYLNSIRPYKRPYRWLKREKIEDLEVIKEHYKYSYEKAKDALSVLSDVQIDEIRKRVDKGGLNVKSKRTHRGDTS